MPRSGNVECVIEVLRYNDPEEDTTVQFATYTHVGYMDKKFASQHAAAAYYHTHNPHMPQINVTLGFGACTLHSTWDPATRLAYAIRCDHDVHPTIAPFKTVGRITP